MHAYQEILGIVFPKHSVFWEVIQIQKKFQSAHHAKTSLLSNSEVNNIRIKQIPQRVKTSEEMKIGVRLMYFLDY